MTVKERSEKLAKYLDTYVATFGLKSADEYSNDGEIIEEILKEYISAERCQVIKDPKTMGDWMETFTEYAAEIYKLISDMSNGEVVFNKRNYKGHYSVTGRIQYLSYVPVVQLIALESPDLRYTCTTFTNIFDRRSQVSE